MPKPETYSVGLLPIAMAAGLLSGGLFRQTPTPEPAKPNPKPAERARDEVLPAGPWLSDLRPVMETIGDAMGLSFQRDAASRTSGVTGEELDGMSNAKVTTAITTIRAGLMRRLARMSECEAIDGPLTTAEQTLNGYLLSDKDSKSSSRELRTAIAEAAVNELQDWRTFLALNHRVDKTDSIDGRARYEVSFIVATVPDYVDSNAGWVADQSLTAIQSAMSRSGHLLDRFRLIDWTRTDPRTDAPVANDSRLHERQPGALIFRKQEREKVRLQIVLLALETPTSGVHRAALRNAIRFIRAWQTCAGPSGKADLAVLGPTFSGSTLSMALTLGDPNDRFPEAFAKIRVISGSATADENVETFEKFAHGVQFSAALQPTSETLRVMAGFLQRMNASWAGGRNVAILKESNTAYGQPEPDRLFAHASIFTFPLHVSQLRSDTPAAPASTVTLLPMPAIPLNMRETTPAADQIPALRPQLTSPVVEATVDTILDTIRHERLMAVGIQATDDRDVLFLAREVKRAAPDVQLFFLGSHTLYLHRESIPYLRGTLVASTYPLSLSTQSRFAAGPAGREPFQSMAAQGLFNATLLLMDSDSAALLDYCDPNAAPGEECRPRVSISVIGEDGFWPLPVDPATRAQNPQYVQAAGAKTVQEFGRLHLPPFPTPASILVVVLVTFVLAQVLMLVFIGRRLRRGVTPRSFLDWPVLRVLAPTTTYSSAARVHRMASRMCFVVVALLFAWVTAVAAPFALSAGMWVVAPVGVVVAAGLVMVPAAQLLNASRHAKRLPVGWPEATQKPTAWLLTPVLLPLALGLAAFAFYVVELVGQVGRPEDQALTLARVVGGGIVSPAAATLCLLAALYIAMFAAMRRASLVGYGYTLLEEKSPAFALINSCRRHTEGRGQSGADDPHLLRRQPARLGDVLDMPAQNLPLPYVIVILLAGLIDVFSVAKISTVDGAAFTWFLGAASAAVLMLGLMYLGQGLLIWNTARAHLKWLALSPIEGAFKSIADLVPWDLSLTPPRLMEIMPVARRADGIVAELRALAGLTERSRHARAGESPDGRRSTDQERRSAEAKLAIREGDLDSVGNLPSTVSKVKILEREIRQRQHAPFMHSSSWLYLWKVSDAIVTLLQRNAWQRLAPQRRSETPALSGLPLVLAFSRLPDAGPDGGGSNRMKVAATLEAPQDSDPSVHRESNDERASLFRHCEEFLALQFAFVLRDIVARTLAMLFTAMLCLTLLTAAHLLYSFNGRSSMLTADLLAVAGAAVASIWILVSMERETVLSRLRNTTPGRLDVNWAFVQRVAVYGVLPLLAVIASLFPEIGNSLFGWLEPLRQLSSF